MKLKMSAGGARIPLLSPEEMSPAQRRFHEAVITGPRGQMLGPLRAAMHSPGLAELWSQFGEFLRFGTSLPPKISELVILVTGRRWTSQVEWWVHAAAATDAGVSPTVVDAIAALQSPAFDNSDDFDAYEYARLLQLTGEVPDELYGRVNDRWGTAGIVELTAIIGYYTMVAMTLNAHRIPVPATSTPLAPVGGLARLPAASMANARR